MRLVVAGSCEPRPASGNAYKITQPLCAPSQHLHIAASPRRRYRTSKGARETRRMGKTRRPAYLARGLECPCGQSLKAESNRLAHASSLRCAAPRSELAGYFLRPPGRAALISYEVYHRPALPSARQQFSVLRREKDKEVITEI